MIVSDLAYVRFLCHTGCNFKIFGEKGVRMLDLPV